MNKLQKFYKEGIKGIKEAGQFLIDNAETIMPDVKKECVKAGTFKIVIRFEDDCADIPLVKIERTLIGKKDIYKPYCERAKEANDGKKKQGESEKF